MGDDLLDSMIGLSSNSNVSLHSLSSLDSLEVLNAEMSSSYMEIMSSSGTYTSTTPPAMVVEEEGDDEDYDSSSTGYLQDVLFEFTSKRRRLQLLFDRQPSYSNDYQHQFHYSNQNYLSSDFIQNYYGHFGTLDQVTNPRLTISDTNQEAISETYDSSPCNSQKESTVTGSTHDDANDDKRDIYCTRPIFPSGVNDEKLKRKRVPPKIVYPFALVKPGGFEGDATLNDINERILMPPTRPVRHPVGDFACRPLVSPQGPGLSGKAVVAFTRVHTQGRGTITIIRTRG